MLHAIKSNKAGINFNNAEINWRQFFKASEDSLTSFVFERLFYLPGELFWSILTQSCFENSLPEVLGNPSEYEFWPHWDAVETANKNYVEPDVFIRFHKYDLIVEAKRWNREMQSVNQWKSQIQAYRNEYGDEKQLLYIALGGIHTIKAEIIEGVEIVKSQWKRILEQVIYQHDKFSHKNEPSDFDHSTLTILSDLIIIFRIHGFATGLWFNTLPVQKYSITTLGSELIADNVRGDIIAYSSIPTNLHINLEKTKKLLWKS
jgi:hypothetical protein